MACGAAPAPDAVAKKPKVAPAALPAKSVTALPPAGAAPTEPAPAVEAPEPPVAPPVAPRPPVPSPIDEAGTAPKQPEGAVRFMDPKWFRSNMFPDATTVDFKRSEADSEGLFTSQLLFDLKEGSTVESCVEVIKTQVGEEVEVTRTDAGGRATLKGNTERYRVVMVCGEAKGVIKAYVSYSWTS